MSTTELNDNPSAKATVALLDSWVIKVFSRVIDLENMVNDMKAEVDELKKTVAEKDEEIAKKDTKLIEIENEIKAINEKPSASNTATKAFSYSELVSGNHKKSETEVVLLAKVRSELNEMNRIERNIIISGLVESVGENEHEIEMNETKAVEELIEELQLDKTRIKRRNRLRKRGVTNNDSSHPSLLLIEFTDSASQATAIANSSRLKNNPKFSKIYVNCDKTVAERTAEALLRRKRNELNQALPHTENTSGGILRYGTSEGNKRFYWGIRGGRLVQLEPRSI